MIAVSRVARKVIPSCPMFRPKIPVLLLKTRSSPYDTYEECFARSSLAVSSTEPSGTPEMYQFAFSTEFVPVLEHVQNSTTLSHLSTLLRDGELKRKYGGMIFTSQRAVEAWADVVHEVQHEATSATSGSRGLYQELGVTKDPFATLEDLSPFPLYVVGPATERALQDLAKSARSVVYNSQILSPYSKLNTSIHGAHAGNGAALASFMLEHYNQIYRDHWFTYFEAPRLPFIPLLGMSSQNYGRKRLDGDDPRLQKKGLLFLVGEVRRDIIPKTLQGQDNPKLRIEVEEMEVYQTEVKNAFEEDFDRLMKQLDDEDDQRAGPRVVVIFSPQGSEAMLRKIGYIDTNGQPTRDATTRWWSKEDQVDDDERTSRWIVVTIGPTTRDYLRDKLGVEPDVCSEKPNPESLRSGIEKFLEEKVLLNTAR